MKELTEDILYRVYSRSISNIDLCSNYILPESFIREHQNNINWFGICLKQKLSEDFIREFQDKVNWDYISWYQELSGEFLKEFEDKINFVHIISNNDLIKYNKEIQLLILKKVIYNLNSSSKESFYQFFTDYMKEQYERLSIML